MDDQEKTKIAKEIKERWSFIEKQSKEFDDLPDWKKVEASPSKFKKLKSKLPDHA